MEGPRAPKNEEWNKIISDLDSKMRPENGWSLRDEYPSVFNPQNLNNMRVIVQEDSLLSHAISKIHIIKTPVGIFKVAAIGSVFTSPTHRQKGLSSHVINSCIENAKTQVCDFAILWTDLFDFYRKFGFELSGFEYSYIIDRPLVESSQLRIEQTSRVDSTAILSLYSKHTVGTIRTPLEVRNYLKIPNSRIYTAWGPNNQLKAYAVEGKGADLQGYIHEWGGDVSDLMALFSHIYSVRKQPTTVIVPRHSKNLIRNLRSSGAKEHQGYLGMIHIVNPDNIMNKVRRYANSLGLDKLIYIRDEKGITVGYGEQAFTLQSEADLSKWIFGPLLPSQVNGFDPEVVQCLEKIFPIPMWIWGWDSI